MWKMLKKEQIDIGDGTVFYKLYTLTVKLYLWFPSHFHKSLRKDFHFTQFFESILKKI